MDDNQDDFKTPDERSLDEHPPNDEQEPTDEPSKEDLINAYKAAKEEADHYRKLLEATGRQVDNHSKLSDRAAFLEGVRGMFQRDPVAAMDEMIKRSQNEVLDVVESYVTGVLEKEQTIERFLADFLNDPANMKLKPFKEELAFLIGKKGMNPGEAASVAHSILGKQENGISRKRAAAQAIRNKATVESDGEPGEPADEDADFAKVVKKAKNLQEMFAGLRKIKYL